MVCPDQKKKTKRKEGEPEEKADEYRELYDECCREVEKLDSKVVF
jgi:H/ACA ribonucleoprotein complex subunit 2